MHDKRIVQLKFEVCSQVVQRNHFFETPIFDDVVSEPNLPCGYHDCLLRKKTCRKSNATCKRSRKYAGLALKVLQTYFRNCRDKKQLAHKLNIITCSAVCRRIGHYNIRIRRRTKNGARKTRTIFYAVGYLFFFKFAYINLVE